MTERNWELTPEAMRAFFKDAAEGAKDLVGPNGDPGFVGYVAEHAIYRALTLGVERYGLNDFHGRDLDGEAEAELLDAENYMVYETLQDLRSVSEGYMQQVQYEEEYREALLIAVELMRVHKRIVRRHQRRRRSVRRVG